MYKVLRNILFSTIFALSIIGNSKAQTYVLIPDANFATYLQGLIPSAMSGNSLNITSTLVTIATQSLYPINMGISDLNGIQYFTSLAFLDCRSNLINSLPALPNSINNLICRNNFLTTLPALPNSLTNLWCSNCTLSSLPTLPSSLTGLNCSYNYIKCFPVFPASIASINLSGNPYDCLPNYVLPAMSTYTAPLCAPGNTNGCAAVGLRELISNNIQISVYPNPSKGSFSIKIDDEINNGELVIINSIGQTVYTSEVKRGVNNIASRITSSGLYQYIILQNKQQFSRGKLLVE